MRDRASRWASAIALTVCFIAAPTSAHAQGRLEIAASVGGAASHDLGSEKAVETGNGVPSGSPVTLFQTSTSLESGPVFEARVGWHLTRALMAEGTFGFTRTELRTSITNDFENPAPTVSRTRLKQYTIEGGLVWQPARLAFGRGRRLQMFITGGGGYLRQLDDGAALVGTGESIFAGGGLKYRMHQAARGALKSLGVRADVRANINHGGLDIDDNAWRAYPSVTGGIYLGF
jgi:hypothetical protein